MHKLLILKLAFLFFIGKAASQTVVTLALPDPCTTTEVAEHIPKELTFDFSVYPNPAEDRIVIDVLSQERIGEIHIQVVALNGAVVLFENIYSDHTSCIKPIDISTLPAGIYVIAIYRGNESLNKKIVIQ